MQGLGRGRPNLFCPLAHQPIPGNKGEAGSEGGRDLGNVSLQSPNMRAEGCFLLHFKPARERFHVTHSGSLLCIPWSLGRSGTYLTTSEEDYRGKACGVVGNGGAKRASLGMACTSKVTSFKMVGFFFPLLWAISEPHKKWIVLRLFKRNFLNRTVWRDEVP